MGSAEQYDLVIIGGGTGGYSAAIRAGQLGMRAAIIESRGVLGGTCLNVGCIPSKALLRTSALFEKARDEFSHIGIGVEVPRINIATMMRAKDAGVSMLAKGVEFLMRKNHVDYLVGRGRLSGGGIVDVDMNDGTTRSLSATNIILATGSEPMPLAGVAVDQRRIVDSEGALTLPVVPKSLVVIGAGIIGLELGSVWRRLGAEVTVVEYLDRIAPGMDDALAASFQTILSRQGMSFRLGTKVIAAVASDRDVVLTVEPAVGGAPDMLSADVVLVAIGRRPFTNGLGLETAGITTDRRGFIPVDRFRTSAPGIWAIGDVISGPMLAHRAEEDAIACVELMAGKAGHVDYNLVPSVVYTHPEVAWVGRTEAQLKADGIAYKVGKFPFTANSRARINHETYGFAKVLVDKATGRILGVHIMGPEAGELIAEACVAMAFGGTADELGRTLHAHPTLSEAVRQAAMDADGWSLQW